MSQYQIPKILPDSIKTKTHLSVAFSKLNQYVVSILRQASSSITKDAQGRDKAIFNITIEDAKEKSKIVVDLARVICSRVASKPDLMNSGSKINIKTVDRIGGSIMNMIIRLNDTHSDVAMPYANAYLHSHNGQCLLYNTAAKICVASTNSLNNDHFYSADGVPSDDTILLAHYGATYNAYSSEIFTIFDQLLRRYNALQDVDLLAQVPGLAAAQVTPHHNANRANLTVDDYRANGQRLVNSTFTGKAVMIGPFIKSLMDQVDPSFYRVDENTVHFTDGTPSMSAPSNIMFMLSSNMKAVIDACMEMSIALGDSEVLSSKRNLPAGTSVPESLRNENVYYHLVDSPVGRLIQLALQYKQAFNTDCSDEKTRYPDGTAHVQGWKYISIAQKNGQQCFVSHGDRAVKNIELRLRITPGNTSGPRVVRNENKVKTRGYNSKSLVQFVMENLSGFYEITRTFTHTPTTKAINEITRASLAVRKRIIEAMTGEDGKTVNPQAYSDINNITSRCIMYCRMNAIMFAAIKMQDTINDCKLVAPLTRKKVYVPA